jgi:hypothetical protein
VGRTGADMTDETVDIVSVAVDCFCGIAGVARRTRKNGGLLGGEIPTPKIAKQLRIFMSLLQLQVQYL